jgi:L-aminopeptidase/D-esterase-like protein
MIDKIHAVVFSGGSAFGLDASSGVMQYLEELGIGFDVGITKVPIVCSAVLYDLNIGDYKIRPDKQMGYSACVAAETAGSFKNGNFGAGAGATVGKLLGPSHAMKGGLGSFSVQIGDLKIGAVAAVNCLGDVVDNSSGKIIAGLLSDDKKTFMNTEHIMACLYNKNTNVFNGNTTIGTIVTNAVLTKAQANKVASMAHNGYARAIHPCHTLADGDTIFTMASGRIAADVNVIGSIASDVMEKAVICAVRSAESLYGYMSTKDLLFK